MPWYRNERGMTLIEVLMLMVILGIIMLGCFTMSAVNTVHLSLAKKKTLANNLAQRKLEELRQMKFDDVEDIPKDPQSDLPQFLDPNDGSTVAGFTYKVKVEGIDKDGDGEKERKSVWVSVYYTGKSGEEEVSLKMTLTRPLPPVIAKGTLKEQYVEIYWDNLPADTKLQVINKDEITVKKPDGTPVPKRPDDPCQVEDPGNILRIYLDPNPQDTNAKLKTGESCLVDIGSNALEVVNSENEDWVADVGSHPDIGPIPVYD